MSLYPNAALFTALVAYADEHGRRPTEVYDDYLAHPYDYGLIFAFKQWRGEQEQKEIDEAKSGSRRPAADGEDRIRGLGRR